MSDKTHMSAETHKVAPIGVPEWGEDREILGPLQSLTPREKIFGLVIVLLTLPAVFVGVYQQFAGLQITGLGKPLFWGIYVTNFVFFIGISYAGTLVSAILRIVGARWRLSITRAAEAITGLALLVGSVQILLDLGRMDRALNILLYPQPRSPLFWDALSISSYLTLSIFYLFVPMIPDMAMCREEYRARGGFRFHLYRVLSFNWKGDERQTRMLNRFINIMMVLIIPVAVSAHTVLAYMFSLTVQPLWHSAIYGPYFVLGAIYSGIGGLLIALALIRRYYGLGRYFKEVHVKNLSYILIAMNCLWFYFTFSEYLTVFYGDEPHEMAVLMLQLKGPYAVHFWGMVACMAVSFVLLVTPRFRTFNGFALAGVFINIGMWLERYIIVTPSLSRPRLPYPTVIYSPSLMEWLETLGSLAGFVLLYWLFVKFFPILPVWEIKEDRERGEKEMLERTRSYAD